MDSDYLERYQELRDLENVEGLLLVIVEKCVCIYKVHNKYCLITHRKIYVWKIKAEDK